MKSYLNEPSMTLAEASYYYTGFARHLLNIVLKITMLRRNIFVHRSPARPVILQNHRKITDSLLNRAKIVPIIL